MKSRLVALLLMALTFATQVQAQSALSGPFTLTVDLGQGQHASDKLYFVYYNVVTSSRQVDSAVVGASPVVFKGNLAEPTQARLILVAAANGAGASAGNNLSLFIEPGNIKVLVKDTLNKGTVTGSSSNAAFIALEKKVEKTRERLKPMYADYMNCKKNNDTAGMNRIEAKADSIEKEGNNVYKQYVEENAGKSPVVLFALTQYAGSGLNPDEVEPLLKKLPKNYQDLPSAKMMAEKISIARKLEIGQYAADFTQNDTMGHPVTLSSFKGKYVLLDFWASWCGPCRAENPNVVKVYNEYKDKGFTVLGVSLDQPGGQEKWMKAIHDDKLEWTQVSDLQFWNNAVAKAYGIQSIPQNFLIDPQGKIIAKGVRGEELEKKLAEVFKHS